jgi:hypothetical protein
MRGADFWGLGNGDENGEEESTGPTLGEEHGLLKSNGESRTMVMIIRQARSRRYPAVKSCQIREENTGKNRSFMLFRVKRQA